MTEDFSLSPEVERLFNRAYELHTAGELREAITWYQQCVEVEPRLAIAWSNLGRCFADLNQHEDALVAYKKAIDQNMVDLPV